MVKFGEQAFDLRVDPGIVAAFHRGRAACDGGGEVAVGGDLEPARQHGAGEAFGQVEPVQRHIPLRSGSNQCSLLPWRDAAIGNMPAL